MSSPLLIYCQQIDPSIGKKLGFGGVILHGLCFYGIVSLVCPLD